MKNTENKCKFNNSKLRNCKICNKGNKKNVFWKNKNYLIINKILRFCKDKFKNMKEKNWICKIKLLKIKLRLWNCRNNWKV